MLRSADALARGATKDEAVDPARSMAEQAHPEGAQRDRASAAEARGQRADHARREGQSDAGAAGGEGRRWVAGARRESRALLLPAGLARSRQASRARTARVPARQSA